jgi:hypothetical protein
MVLKANTEAFRAGPEVVERFWSGPAFWIRWVGATTLGWALSNAILGVLTGLTGQTETPLIRGLGALLALVTLSLQWLVLRPWLVRAWRWIPVSFAGEAAGLGLFIAGQLALRLAMGGETTIPEAMMELFITSLPQAIAQWLLLRTVARNAWRWLVANLFWILLFIPVYLFFALLDAGAEAEGLEPITGVGPAIQQAIFLAIIGSVLGFVASAITGAELAWLLRHPKTPKDGPAAE